MKTRLINSIIDFTERWNRRACPNQFLRLTPLTGAFSASFAKPTYLIASIPWLFLSSGFDVIFPSLSLSHLYERRFASMPMLRRVTWMR